MMATVQHANFIQYGRRAGKTKADALRRAKAGSAPVPGDYDGRDIGSMVTAEGTDLRQIKVLPRHEWDRIQYHLHAKEQERERRKQEKQEQDELKAQSKEMVENWSNTIAGQRQTKLLARKLREEREEEYKKKLDIEEAKYQAMKRKEAIEKAKTAQYFQTDRVKGFHGALLLTEVLKERDAQVELNKQKYAALIGKDSALLKRYQDEYERGVIEDQLKAKARVTERKKVAEYQQAQIAEHGKARAKEQEENMREGEEIRKLTKLHEWEQRKLEEIKKEEKVSLMKAHKEHHVNKEAIQVLEEQQDEEENEEIRLFAAAKRRMMKLRKEKEAQLFKEVMEHKDKMTNMLAAQLKQKVDDEDVRIVKATEEKEKKLQKEMNEKQEKLKRDLAGIATHRNEQFRLKEIKAKEDKQRSLELLAMKLEADRLFAEKQAERNRDRRDNYKNLRDFHLAQINERAEKERNSRDEELLHDRKLIDLLALEEDQFQQYADKVISEAREKDRNPYPLIKAAQAGAGGGRGPAFDGKGGIRPSYLTADGYGVQMPNRQRSSTQDIKAKSDPGNAALAKKRLGFVW